MPTDRDTAESRHSTRRRNTRAWIGPLALLALAACQSGSTTRDPLTLEEAKSVSLEFDPSGYVKSKGGIESFERRLGPMRPVPQSCTDVGEQVEKAAAMQEAAPIARWRTPDSG